MVLIDTSSLVHFLRRKGDPLVKQRVRELLLSGDAVICPIIEVELWMGVGSSQDEKNIENLTRLLPSLPIHEVVWALSKKLAFACKKSGTPLPCTDLLIAACAFTHQVRLEYQDQHFVTLESLYQKMRA